MKMENIIFVSFLLFGTNCTKDSLLEQQVLKGKLVGSVKCADSEQQGTQQLGFFIITDKNDSLLSFNVPASIYMAADTGKIAPGISFYDGDSVLFKYRLAENSEVVVFDCPPSTMMGPTFPAIEKFSQIVISDMTKIK